MKTQLIWSRVNWYSDGWWLLNNNLYSLCIFHIKGQNSRTVLMYYTLYIDQYSRTVLMYYTLYINQNSRTVLMYYTLYINQYYRTVLMYYTLYINQYYRTVLVYYTLYINQNTNTQHNTKHLSILFYMKNKNSTSIWTYVSIALCGSQVWKWVTELIVDRVTSKACSWTSFKTETSCRFDNYSRSLS